MGSPWCDYPRPAYSGDPVEVTLTHAFVMAQHETTRAEWFARGLPVTSPDPNEPPPDTRSCTSPTCPIGDVTWFDALAYANELSQAHDPPLPTCYSFVNCKGRPGEGLVCERADVNGPSLYGCAGYRLPTEAEWEYAARAGTTTSYYTGQMSPIKPPASSDCIADKAYDNAAWYCANSGNETHPYGLKTPNGWGLADILGNSFEWVNDWKDGLGYGKGPLVDPRGTLDTQSSRIIRGGNVNIWPSAGRVSDRIDGPWSGRAPNVGFRLVRTLAKGETFAAVKKVGKATGKRSIANSR